MDSLILLILLCHWSLLCLMCKNKRVCAPTFAEARLQSCGRHQAIPHHYCTHLLQFSHLKKGKKWKDACQFNKYRRDVNKLLKYDLWLIPFWPESIILITLVPLLLLAVEDTNAKLVDFVDEQLVSKIYLRKSLSTKKSFYQIIFLPKNLSTKNIYQPNTIIYQKIALPKISPPEKIRYTKKSST